jgi:hypothetical protein
MPGIFGVMWNDDLMALGYLQAGGSEARALGRFQRHAKRKYRRTAAGESLLESPVYEGPEDGVAHQATLDEILRWVQEGYRLPLGFFGITKIENWGALRADAAAAWAALMGKIRQIGGTIDGPYGDTKRPLTKTISVGASKYSFHIPGRAVDLNQGLGNTRYFVVAEPQMWWRIYCRTADQSGAQGSPVEAGIRYHNFYTKQDVAMPEGCYIDLTAAISNGGLFERIRAQHGWETDTRKSEWWHFQWTVNKQKTFQDECELEGISEQELRAAGYQDADLDQAPG